MYVASTRATSAQDMYLVCFRVAKEKGHKDAALHSILTIHYRYLIDAKEYLEDEFKPATEAKIPPVADPFFCTAKTLAVQRGQDLLTSMQVFANNTGRDNKAGVEKAFEIMFSDA